MLTAEAFFLRRLHVRSPLSRAFYLEVDRERLASPDKCRPRSAPYFFVRVGCDPALLLWERSQLVQALMLMLNQMRWLDYFPLLTTWGISSRFVVGTFGILKHVRLRGGEEVLTCYYSVVVLQVGRLG